MKSLGIGVTDTNFKITFLHLSLPFDLSSSNHFNNFARRPPKDQSCVVLLEYIQLKIFLIILASLVVKDL